MPPPLTQFIWLSHLWEFVERARAEDMGPGLLDITGETLMPREQRATASVVARQAGTVAGLMTLPTVVAVYDRHVTLELQAEEGDAVKRGQSVATVNGPLRSILAIERVALNLLTHLSGIATLTRRFVDAVEGTGASIVDTRKTLPGLRGLQKYAVACGGGTTHRLGLHDAMLVKDNHIAHLSLDELPQALERAAAEARRRVPYLKFVEVEVDTLEQLERVLPVKGVDYVLLDNMTPGELREAVAMRDRLAAEGLPAPDLEASGGVTLDTVRAIAEAGVDRISVGALTHSVTALDFGLDIATPREGLQAGL